MKLIIDLKPQTYKNRFKDVAHSRATGSYCYTIGTYGTFYSKLGPAKADDNIVVLRSRKVNKKVVQKKVKNKKKLSFINKQTGESFVPEMITQSTVIRQKEWTVEKFEIPKAVMSTMKLQVKTVTTKGGDKIKFEKR